MPHLTIAVTPAHGPVIDLIVGVSTPRETALIKAGQPVPTAVSARLLIDTGASSTVIDPEILTKLGLSPTGAMMAHTPSTQGTPVAIEQYDVKIVVPHQSISRHFHAVPVGACQMRHQGIDGLLGRDVLAECLFMYLGPDNVFVLSI